MVNQLFNKLHKSERLYKKALELMPGGVSSPVRACKSVDTTPVFIKKGLGPHIYDVDGYKYIDYVCSWGPLILGHAYPDVVHSIINTAKMGTSFGAPTELEVELASLINKAMPSLELIRFVNSGTEAVMGAIRLSRAFTGRAKILKFEGGYHGHADSMLVSAGSGATTMGIPDSPGVNASVAADTIVAQFNHIDSVKKAFQNYPDEIAAIIVEPVQGNAGCILPRNNFLQGLRKLCDQHKTILIFDEVMTGFRVAAGGAQSLYNVKPDLTTLAKIIGGGLPVGAYGGRKDIMEWVAPAGPVYQAGTLSGNPLAMACGIATLKTLMAKNIYPDLNNKTQQLVSGMKSIAHDAGIPLYASYACGMFSIFFTDQEVIDYTSAKTSCVTSFKEYFQKMLSNGIYLPPSQFESCFLSAVHEEEDLQGTLDAFEHSVRGMSYKEP